MLQLSKSKLLAGLLAVAGIGYLGSSYWIEAKAGLAQVLLEHAWVMTLDEDRPVKAWTWADTWPVAVLEMPRLDKRMIVLEGSSGEAMAFAPGHMVGTPMPGDNGTSIIAAHRNTHFEFLEDVELGDLIQVTGASGTLTVFGVTERRIVDAQNSGLEPDQGNGRLALVTCYPFGAIFPGPLRYVIIAERQEFAIRAIEQSQQQ